jgi:hypothetical protein
MRRMIAQFIDASIRQFRCADCDWVFHVQQPVTPELSVEVQQSYAQQWFAAHHCEPPSNRENSLSFTTVSSRYRRQDLAHSGGT